MSDNKNEAPDNKSTPSIDALGSKDTFTRLDESNLNFNRIALTSAFKNQICEQIGDSTDSLPTWGLSTGYDEGEHARSRQSTAGQVPDTSDLKTPMPKESDPLSDAAPAKKIDSRQLTMVDTVKTVGSTDTEGKRPGTLRRLTTKLRKTMSSSHQPKPER
jgi:hypothetical protein